MCSSQFRESTTRTIDLSTDDPKIVALLVEYLYLGDYWPLKGPEFTAYRSVDKDQRAIQMQREAELYCLAAMYQLEGMYPLSF